MGRTGAFAFLGVYCYAFGKRCRCVRVPGKRMFISEKRIYAESAAWIAVRGESVKRRIRTGCISFFKFFKMNKKSL